MADDSKPPGYDTLREALAAIIEHEADRRCAVKEAKPVRERLGLNFGPGGQMTVDHLEAGAPSVEILQRSGQVPSVIQ